MMIHASLHPQSLILFLSLLFPSMPAIAKISANHKAGGVVIGQTTVECDHLIEGALRWSSGEKTHEMCDGSNWRKIIAASGAGIPSIPPGNPGYFVLTAGTWNGNLIAAAGISPAMEAANKLCLDDLTDNDWMGKDDAIDRGLLNATKVRAFLCNTPTQCNNLVSEATYKFAVGGYPAIGGAFFAADANNLGPGNNQSWSGINYFGGTQQYWTYRDSIDSTLWADGGPGSGTTGMYRCGAYNTRWDRTSESGAYGEANSTNQGRWYRGTLSCETPLHLICIVHP